MSEFLKIEPNKNYFITLTIVDWIDLFTRECYVKIFIDSIKYCQGNKGLDLYAYVVMSSHIHMIAGTSNNLSNILRDLKEHTSKLFIKEIMKTEKKVEEIGYLKSLPDHKVVKEKWAIKFGRVEIIQLNCTV